MRSIDGLMWADVKLKEIKQINDIKKRKVYAKKIKLCYSKVVNLLVNLITNREFNFSLPDEELTCRIMVREVNQELYKQGYTKEEILDYVKENNGIE